MNLYAQFGTDRNLEQSGVIVSYGDEGSPEFKIARMGGSNKNYKKAVEEVHRKHKHAINSDSLSEEFALKINKEVFVSTILLDWKNVEDKNGNVLELNEKNALKLFHDLPDLYSDLVLQAQNANLFREKEIEAEAKN